MGEGERDCSTSLATVDNISKLHWWLQLLKAQNQYKEVSQIRGFCLWSWRCLHLARFLPWIFLCDPKAHSLPPPFGVVSYFCHLEQRKCTVVVRILVDQRQCKEKWGGSWNAYSLIPSGFPSQHSPLPLSSSPAPSLSHHKIKCSPCPQPKWKYGLMLANYLSILSVIRV